MFGSKKRKGHWMRRVGVGVDGGRIKSGRNDVEERARGTARGTA